MILQDFAMQTNDFTYSIYGSDISTQVLQKAVLAIYSLEHAAPVPMTFKQRYLLKSKDSDRQTVRVVPQLRNKVQFSYMNLMDSKLDIEGDLDVIFCRNVLIYFDRKTQLEVVNKLTQKLRPGGYLFIGHSESLHNFELPITQLKPTIYIKK
jgi:chemotaxis protein methyltransferase CheR